MVAGTLHNDEEENRYWTLWHITIGSLACMCCVVFLGLKFKWFRAQLRLGESPRNGSTAPVQGVGFKMKTNPEDFQVYKVISEFAPVTPQIQQKPQQNATQNKIQNGTSMTAVTVKPTTNNPTNLTTKPLQTPVNTPNNKISPPKKQAPPKIRAPQPEVKPILKQQPAEGRQHKNSVNFDTEVTEISSPNDQKYSDLINNRQNSEDIDEYQQLTKVPQQSLHSKNPLAARNFTMPVEDEDEWSTKVVHEKPKAQPKAQTKQEEYFVAPTSNINSNMYSSQAASIFFAGQAPVAQPRARKFVEMDEDDNVSTESQTTA